MHWFSKDLGQVKYSDVILLLNHSII